MMSPPHIKDYAYIGDCHSSALISCYGSIDWCCMPRVDSPPCFSRLLGWEEGGFCQITPTQHYSISRNYLEDTMILKTTFATQTGECNLYDFFAMRRGGKFAPYNQIIRIIEGIKGELKLSVMVAPIFDYGAVKPWMRVYKEEAHIALGGSYGLLISGNMDLNYDRYFLKSEIDIKANEKKCLSIIYSAPEDLDNIQVEIPAIEELHFRKVETEYWWRNWVAKGQFSGEYQSHLKRSALTLKALSNAPTGAIAAAPTTSLPEALDGNRNWDYRYSWIRDSCFSVVSLSELGFIKEADDFRKFIQRSSHCSPEGLQILFGVGGERRLHEFEIPELSGFHQSKPVRVGNKAETQLQLDMYGHLLDLAQQWHLLGKSPDADYQKFLVCLANKVCKDWQKPDRGIWEIRGEPQHFTHSKVMCWVALDRAINIMKSLSTSVDTLMWEKTSVEIRHWVETHCVDHEYNYYVQAAGSKLLDASLLLLPIFGFTDYLDVKMVNTVNAIRKKLEYQGLLKRYDKYDDGLQGNEGYFLACSFWLVICLANQNQISAAKQILTLAMQCCNDVLLFSEEYDPSSKMMLGNFPQALTHLAMVSAVLEVEKLLSH